MLIPTLMSLLVRAYIFENLVRRGRMTECRKPVIESLDENAADELKEGERESLTVVVPAIDVAGAARLCRERERNQFCGMI